MFRRFLQVGDPYSEPGRALLREQYRALREQIPVMYGSLFVNATCLSLASYGAIPTWLSVGMPAVLCLACFIRLWIWVRRRDEELPSIPRIQRALATTWCIAVVLAASFVLWGFLLFPRANLIQQAAIGMFIFIAALTTASSLQTFPQAVRAVLLVGTAPMALRLAFADHWFLTGLAFNILFISMLMQRIGRANYAGFAEVVASRSRVALEGERAKAAERRAHDLAYRDPLTALPNRRALVERLEQLIATRDEHDGAALLMVDLDRFKDVNDLHGHPAGDELLRKVARRLSELVEGAAEVYRLGGDEFAVIAMLDQESRTSPTSLARKMVEAMDRPFEVSPHRHHIGASIGIAFFPLHAEDRETLMRKTDIALYEAKTSGRGAFRMFRAEMEDVIRYRSSIERNLREDIRSGAVQPYFQPIVDLATRQVVSFELLARWSRDGRFVVGPEQFIPIAEDCGIINELMLALLEQGCREGRGLTQGMPMAVNISPIQLKDPQLGERILAVLERCDYPPSCLGIEVTENALVSDSASVLRTITMLKAHGVQVALDDFGTGYSSLRHLHLLPIDKIKIDRSFVTSMPHDPEARKIVRAIVSLAATMGLRVIAEGIESEEVAQQLQTLGCAEGQGFHFGHPAPARPAMLDASAA